MASAYMFSHYFSGGGGGGDPESPKVTYPQWQSSVSTLHGGLLVVPPMPVPRIRQRLRLLWRVAKLVFHPKFDKALHVVKTVAHTPHMNGSDPRGWGEIARVAHSAAGVPENIHRKLLAEQLWNDSTSGDRDVRDTLLQLAYLSYKRDPRG